jgi:quercetin dioxygenase-like cupin family protein
MIFVTAMVRTYPTMGTVHRRRSERAWEGVAAQAYDDSSLAGVEKHELIGPAEGAPHYRVRYFHVPAGGRTALERHDHDHGVVIQAGRARVTLEVPAGQHTAREQHPHDHGVVIERGRARVTLGDEVHEVGPGDVVYVAGDELHCFEALGDEPLGFICVAPPARSG